LVDILGELFSWRKKKGISIGYFWKSQFLLFHPFILLVFKHY